MSLSIIGRNAIASNNQMLQKTSLSIIDNFFRKFHYPDRGTSRCIRRKASLTVETAAVMPFFACFLVFILFFSRIIQIQSGVAQALQYAGRRLAAECCDLSESNGSVTGAESGQAVQPSGQGGVQSSLADGLSSALNLAKSQAYFRKELEEQNCPTKFIRGGNLGISIAQSDLSGDYIELKAVYQMRLPVGLLGNIHYQVVQESKCRKWTGFLPGQDGQEGDDEWVYYTPHGTVYHTSRSCAYLDLSIRGVPYRETGQNRNSSGGKYYPCEECGGGSAGSMVYITDYGNRYHSSLACSGLKRTVYMIRKSEATDRRMCSKCGG